jgi:MFS family permease
VVAVFNRSSLGVAGIAATERFGIPASTLAALSVVQLVVYAGMQVPVGVLLDRFGTRRMVVAGSALMALGQLVFALTDQIEVAFGARVLIGAGDAMIFISVLRLVIAWFPARRVPLVQQLTGIVGQTGAVLAAVPLVGLLGLAGWTSSFALAAAVGVLAAVVVLAMVRDTPGARAADRPPAPGIAEVRRTLAAAWREPGTQLALWTHFVAPFSAQAFVLLWGYPFLVRGQGLSPGFAAGLLTVITVAGMVCGPVVGQLVSRHPFHRSRVVLAIVAVTAAVWSAVLLWPGRAPGWLLVVLAIVLATNGPGSMIAFDFTRTFNPPARLGSASGIVNVGGFVATLMTVFLIGAILDVLGRTGSGSATEQATDFRLAFAVQYLLWTLGAVQVVRYRRRARRRLAREHPDAFAALRAGQVVTPVG